jgi:hypothetical protein
MMERCRRVVETSVSNERDPQQHPVLLLLWLNSFA